MRTRAQDISESHRKIAWPWEEPQRKNEVGGLSRRPEPESFVSEKKSVISTQPAITCSKLTIETLEQGVKYVQS